MDDLIRRREWRWWLRANGLRGHRPCGAGPVPDSVRSGEVVGQVIAAAHHAAPGGRSGDVVG